MLIHRLSTRKLGANAIGACCENWLFVVAKFEQAGESTEPTHCLWAGSALRERRKQLNGAVAFFNVDACRGVGIFRHVRSSLSVLFAEQGSHSVSIGVSGWKTKLIIAIKAGSAQLINGLMGSFHHVINGDKA